MPYTNSRLSILFFLPAGLFMGVFLLYPLFLLLKDSLFSYNILEPAAKQFVGLQNYMSALTSERFLQATWNTIVYIVAAVGIEFLLGLTLALLLNTGFRGSQLIRTLLLAPLMIAPLVSGLVWKFMLNNQFGIINWILFKLGIISSPQQILWLSEAKYALLSTIIADVWLTTPFLMLVLLAGLQGIPKGLYEASQIDGANRWQTFRYVTMPALAPVAIVAVLIRMIDAARTFDIVWVLTQGGPGFSSEVLSTYMYKMLTRYGHVGEASAMAVIFIILLLCLSSFFISKVWSPSAKKV
ncbi:carbohydrate ABC transporter permease [Halobacillus mangrovi]|uniref:carbohydrate ABC transporter permease n=1 Tax=Halobacillus mangrovi TaxID=402384 RepID=UPI003D98DDF6